MVSFTVEEALANLKDPLHPQFIKKDMEEEQNSTEGTNSFGGGLMHHQIWQTALQMNLGKSFVTGIG